MLLLFCYVNSELLCKVCEIICDDIYVDVVVIINIDYVLVYVGVGEYNYQNGDDFISLMICQVMNYGKIIIKNNDEVYCMLEIYLMLVILFWEKGVVIGMLKIYYCYVYQIILLLQEMVVGLL